MNSSHIHWVMKRGSSKYCVLTLRAALELKSQGYEPVETCNCDKCKVLMGETDGMTPEYIRNLINRDKSFMINYYREDFS